MIPTTPAPDADRRSVSGRPSRLPSPAMDPTRPGRRDAVLLAVVLVGLSRFADGPAVWLVAGLTLVAIGLAGLWVLSDADPATDQIGVPIEAVLVPAVAAAAGVGGVRLVPIGLGLVVALAAVALLVDRALRLEARLLAQPHGPSSEDRTALLVHALVVAFVAFAGVAALVPGGLPEPSAPPAGAGLARPADEPNLSEGGLLLLAAVDAITAGLLGYRAAALRATNLRAALWSAGTYAGAIAIGAAALRAMTIPRLIGPALLTLVFFLWDAVQGTPPSRRRDTRWLWQTALLAVLGVAVVVLNLSLRS
jgi:hypothetical protein